jgi:hypothetical protein
VICGASRRHASTFFYGFKSANGPLAALDVVVDGRWLFGSKNQEGHGAFACRSLGITIWGDDVLEFVDAAMKATSPARP